MLNLNETRKVLTLDEVRERAPSVFATKPHESVSSEYKFIPTIDALQSLINEGWQVTQAGEHRSRKEGKKGYQKHLLRLNNPNLPKIGDSEVDLLFYNSHDRTSAFKFLAGLYRFVCANGMVCGQDLFKPISVRHMGYKASNVLEAAYRVIEDVPKITESVHSMNEVELSQDERISLARSAIVAKYGTPKIDDETGKALPYPVTPEIALMVNRDADQGHSLWKTFNVIQENLIRGGQKDWTSGRRQTREMKSIDKVTNLNQALWTLAEEMKRLKVG